MIEASLAVVIRDGRVLLVRRGHRPDAGLWGFPGGKREPGETALDCALRELHEETGLTATEGHRLGALEISRAGRDYRLDAWACPKAAGRASPADDAEEAAWFPIARVIAGALMMSADVDRLTLRAAHLGLVAL
ncbi:NUDIX hydrolase [Roseivivax sp.]